jgi:ribonucleotide reductase, class II
MLRQLKRQRATFQESAPAANLVFFRTYNRLKESGLRETWEQVCDRTLRGLVEQNLSLVSGDM